MRCSSLVALVAAIAFLVCLVTCTVSVSGHHHHGKVQAPVTAADRAASWAKSSHSHGHHHHQSSFTPFDRDNDNDRDDRDDNDNDLDDDDDDDDDEYMPFGDRSSICRQYDCPRFNATSYPTYTIRTYPSTTVACSVIRSFKYGANEQTRAFQRLYEYFGGESDQGTKINMTVPVIRYVKPGNGSHPNVTVCFFLPESLSGNPPKPKNSDVVVFNTSFTVAIKPFFGWGTHENVGINLIRHQFALSLVGQDWVKDRYVHAAYTEPWIPIFRYNEIWTLIPSQHSPREDDLMSQMEQPRSPSQPQPQPQPQHHGRRRFHTRPRLLQDTM